MPPSGTVVLDGLAGRAKKFGPSLARRAYAAGLAVTLPDGSTRPIPVTATPVILDDEELSRRARLSRILSTATFKVAQASLRGAFRQELLAGLSPLERRLAEETAPRLKQLATVRVDYFVSDRPWALEVNATIPAMQGYSDIAAEAFIREVTTAFGADSETADALVERNGSNAAALYQALCTSFAAEKGPSSRPNRIAILCRSNDAQISELRHLAKRFETFGTPARIFSPEEIHFDGEKITAHGERFDLVYRHLFVRRLEQLDAPEVKALYAAAPTREVSMINGPASHVEVKAVFGELSRALEDPALAAEAGLTEEELEAVSKAVPWTRRFRAGASLSLDGTRVKNLVDHVAEHPEAFVLKRSWDYGGKQVFLGATVGDASFEERVVAAYGSNLSWRELCERAAGDSVGGGFVVQQVIPTEAEPHLLCTESDVREVQLFVDYSGYASVGPGEVAPWGGVCRGSVSRIVNIVGGGGVIPLLKQSVATELEALMARTPV